MHVDNYKYPAMPSARACFDEQKLTARRQARARRAELVIYFGKSFWVYYTEDFIFYILCTFLIYNCSSTEILKPRPILNAVRQGRGMVIGQQLFLTYRGLDARRLARAAEELFE